MTYLLRRLALNKYLTIKQEANVLTDAHRALSIGIHEIFHRDRVEHFNICLEAGLVLDLESDSLWLGGCSRLICLVWR